MGFRIRCGGYKTPFDPFKRADGTIVCTPEGQDLSLWCSKLAPKQQDQWLAAASWTSTEGDRVGAMAWRGKNDAGTVDRGDIYWDKDPLPYDPRPEGDRESWGEHRPRYGGNGWWTGAVFSDARDVEISNPADVSATTYQLAPGATIVPQLAAPYYGGFIWRPDYWPYYFSIDSVVDQSSGNPHDWRTLYDQMPWSPIAGYSAYSAYCFGERVAGQIYKFNDSYVFDSNLSVSIVTPQFAIGTRFGYSVFYPNTLPENIPDTHETAAPPSRPPQPGDMIATFLGRTIQYQASQGGAIVVNDYDGYPEYADIPPIPAGTLVTYSWAQSGIELAASISSKNNSVDVFGRPFTSLGIPEDGINNRYGVSVTGTKGASEVNRTGKCYIFEWWRDQYVLHEGTYSISQKSRTEESEDRPKDSTGPANSGTFPGWPSKRRECENYQSTLVPFSINLGAVSYLKEITTNVTLTWSGFAGTGGSQTVPYKTLEWTSSGYSESGLYDPAKGARPSVLRTWQQIPCSYHAYYPYKDPQAMFAPFDVTAVGAVERRPNGDRIGGCFQEGAPSVDASTGGLVNLGVNTGGAVFSDGSPASCTIYGAYYHGGLVNETVNTPFIERRGAPNEGSSLNCDSKDNRKGSSLPGFPLDDPSVPELPGGLGNQASSKSVTEVVIEYEIQAPIARGMTSRSYYYEKTTEATGGEAQWNGSIPASTYTAIETTTATLEFRDPVTLIRDDLAGFEEVLFVVMEFDRKSGSFPTNPPPPADRSTIYYQKEGGGPIAVNPLFKEEFPEAAWADPRSWNWSQWLGLKDGVVYFYKHDPAAIEDYRGKDGAVKGDRYRVSDGSFTLLGTKRFDAKTLSAPQGRTTVFDHNAFP